MPDPEALRIARAATAALFPTSHGRDPGDREEPPPHDTIPPEADRTAAESDFPGDKPWPNPDKPDAGTSQENPTGAKHQAAAPEIISLPPLTLDEWRARDLPDPDFIMGFWLTTTTRALLTAATGLGKTNFGLALGMRVAAGVKFLHWQARRPCRVLYIDGEMSARLAWQIPSLTVVDSARRL